MTDETTEPAVDAPEAVREERTDAVTALTAPPPGWANPLRDPRDGRLIGYIATDGETFGHHHHFAERALAYALPVEAPRHAIDVTTVAAVLDASAPTTPVEVRVSSWSCTKATPSRSRISFGR